MKLWLIVRRNLSLFFMNKLNLLLSLASVGVVVGLYVLFLRDFVTGLMTQNGVSSQMVEAFTDRLMLPGLLPVIGATTCFGLIQICVSDAEKGIRKDYFTAPVPPCTLLIGYWAAAGIVSFFFSVLTLLGQQAFFSLHYEAGISGVHLLRMIGILFCSSFLNAAIVLLFAKGLKNTATFSTFANLYGTLIGFLAGSYLPYHFYPSWLKPILFFFSPAQLVSLCRQESLAEMKHCIFPPEAAQSYQQLYRDMGVLLQWDGKEVSPTAQMWLLAGAMVCLLGCLCVAVTGRRHTLRRKEGEVL